MAAPLAVTTPSSPSAAGKAGRWGLRPVPVSTRIPPAEPLSQQSKHAGRCQRRERGAGVRARGWAGIPEGAARPARPAQGGVTPRRWRHLGFPWLLLRAGAALALPGSRWPLQPGTCSQGGCQEGAGLGPARASSASSREACWRPRGARRGLCWCRRSRGAGPSPQGPLLTLQVSQRRARAVLSSVCWGLVGGEGGQEDREEKVGCSSRGYR